MSYFIVASKSRKSEILHQIMQFQRDYGYNVEEVRTKDAEEFGISDWAVRGSEISPDLEAFDFRFWDNFYLGLDISEAQSKLRRSRKTLLAFGLHTGVDEIDGRSDGNRTEGAIAEVDGKLWLVHTGKVHHYRLKPTSKDVIEISGKSYFKVSEVYSDSLFENIVAYHQSRYSPQESVNLVAIEPQGTRGLDKGPAGNGTRSSATWEAKHSPIVARLVECLENIGWVQTRINGWKPDIFMKNNSDVELLIEVKPEPGDHNIITAIGQIICYRSDLASNARTYIAIPEISIRSRFLKIMKKYDIEAIDLARDWEGQLRRL